jgi:hypothetical protein
MHHPNAEDQQRQRCAKDDGYPTRLIAKPI